MITVELLRTHAGPVAAGHPWVFAQAVQRVRGTPVDGAEVIVEDPTGKGLGRGFWSANSAIPVRLLTRDASQALDDAFFRQRIVDAVALRALVGLPSAESNGYRLIHAEGDGLPGLIVDVFGETAVMQLLTCAMLERRTQLAQLVAELARVRNVITAPNLSAKSETPTPAEVLVGEMPEALSFVERGLRFALAATGTQKTGYYFDQRAHRARVEALARGRDVLDAFCYVGSFGLAAARGGARSVLALDSSEPALQQGERVARENGLGDALQFARADVRVELGRMVERGASFDLVVLDPPKLVPTSKHLERGRHAYRKLNRDALALVRPGGVLVTCSCSAAMTETDFLRMLSFAAGDARRELRIFEVGRQGPDHPLLPGFSEGAYLKTVFAMVR